MPQYASHISPRQRPLLGTHRRPSALPVHAAEIALAGTARPPVATRIVTSDARPRALARPGRLLRLARRVAAVGEHRRGIAPTPAAFEQPQPEIEVLAVAQPDIEAAELSHYVGAHQRGARDDRIRRREDVRR